MWNLLKAEFIKARSLRSTWILLLVSILVMVGMALMLTVTVLSYGEDGTVGLGTDNTTNEISGHDLWALATGAMPVFYQTAVGILMVLLVTSEYTSGTIRASLLATPRRWKLFVAKSIFGLALVSILTFLGEILAFIVVWLVQQGQLDSANLWTALSHNFAANCLAPVLAITLGSAVWLGLGWFLRNSAAAIFTGLGLFLLLSILIGLGGSNLSLVNDLAPQTFFNHIFYDDNLFLGIVGLSSYTFLALLAGLIVLQSRDA
jgi:ABC-type transport system involved in multi-copper enzyme maturation permease subunit